MSDVEAKKAKWFWKNRIPVPGITLLEGDGGIGKSFLTADIVARATTDSALPGDTPKPPINVILLALEDDPEVVLKPRYQKQGADCSRIFFFDKTFHLNQANLELLRTEIKRRSASLVIIDPVIAYFPSGDTNKSKDVRDFMGGLHELSKELGVAVLAIRHWNKNSHGKASQRGAGSVDFRNASRSVLQVIKTEETTFLALEKSNYAAQAKSLAFSITDSELIWGQESDLTAEEILKIANQVAETDKTALDEAMDFLKDELEDGPVSAKDINRRAKEEGISPQTLRRAREALGLKARKINGIKGRGYFLPKKQEVVQVVQSSRTEKDEQDEQEVVQSKINASRDADSLFGESYQKVIL